MADYNKNELIWARNNAAPGDEKPVVQMKRAKFAILSKGGDDSPWEEVSDPNEPEMTGETAPAEITTGEPTPAPTPAPAPTRPARSVAPEKENV